MTQLPTTTTTGLEVRNVRAWYGKNEALHGISLTMPERSVTALMGPSGCGKSTFVRCLNRMHEETYGGHDIFWGENPR